MHLPNIEAHKNLPEESALKQYHPSNQLYVIGITGTNGKTTVSYLIR